MLDQVPEEPSNPTRRSLLSCPACQAICPLGDGTVTRCVGCGAEVPVPELVRAERDERRVIGAERRARNPLWQRALRTRPRMLRSPVLLATLSFIAPFAAAFLGYNYGYREARYGQAGLVWLLAIGVIHFCTSALLESRKRELLRGLLLARPAQRDGGPPQCRVCAAPLTVPAVARAEDVTCDHCGLDNILPRPGEIPPPPRPELLDAEAAFRELYGDDVSQRASRLYPFTILIGFVVLAVLTYFAVEAPRGKLP